MSDADPEPRHLVDLLDELPRWGARPALGAHGDLALRWWSYRRLHDEAVRASALLARAGVAAGDRLVLWAGNSPEWAAVFLGAVRIGAVPVPIDTQQGAAFARRVVEESAAKLVLYERAAPPAGVSEAWQPLESFLAAAPASEGPPPSWSPQPDDPAVILYSSGSTAAPKGVVLTHGNLVAQLATFRGWRRVLRWIRVRALALVPLSHVMGLVIGLLLPLSLGLSVVYSRSVHPARWAQIIREYRVVILIAVPRSLGLLRELVLRRTYARVPAAGDRRARGGWRTFWYRGRVFGRFLFRLILVGGARLPTGTERFWRRSGILLCQGYGLTETAGFVTVSNPFAWRSGDIGSPVGRQEVRVSASGELLVRGPNLSPGYYGRTDLPSEHGFLATGDLARVDERGRLRFVGRAKEVIVTAEGANVHAEEVEAVLDRQAGVRESAVVAYPGEGGDEVHAVVTLEDGASAGEAVAAANHHLEPHQRIRGWTVWPGPLPRTGLEKLRRRVIAAAVVPGASTPIPAAEPPPSFREVRQEADRGRRIELLARYLLGGRPDPAEPSGVDLATDLGLGSLDLVTLLVRLEEWRGPLPLPVVDDGGASLAALRSALAAAAEAPQRASYGGSGAPGSRRVDRLPGRQPRYATWPVVRLLRRVVRAGAIGLWTVTGYRVETRWRCDPTRVPEQFLLVAMPHRNPLEVFAICRALPRRLRRRMMFFTNRDFHEAFAPEPGTPLVARLNLAWLYFVALPLLFCFAILSPRGRTRQGLAEAAKLIDRGYSAIAFPKGLDFFNPDRDRIQPGVGALALETGLPLLPVVLTGHEEIDWTVRRPRRRIVVHLGAPIAVGPASTAEAVVRSLEAAFSELSIAAGASGSENTAERVS